MKSSLRVQFEQLAQRPVAPRTASGSPVDLELTVPRSIRLTRPIDSIRALRDGGLTLAEAKSAYERLIVQCALRIHLPGVDNVSELRTLLAECGITATQVQHALT